RRVDHHGQDRTGLQAPAPHRRLHTGDGRAHPDVEHDVDRETTRRLGTGRGRGRVGGGRAGGGRVGGRRGNDQGGRRCRGGGRSQFGGRRRGRRRRRRRG